MPILKEFDLALPIIGPTTDEKWKEKRMAFSNEVRCICALYERLFPTYKTDCSWKVIVRCVEKPIDQIKTVAGVTEVHVSFNIDTYNSLKPDATTAMIRIRIQQEIVDLNEESARLAIVANIATYIEWFQTVSSPPYLISLPFAEYEKFTTNVPLFWEASFHMYRFYAHLELEDLELAKKELIHFEHHLSIYQAYQPLLAEAKQKFIHKGGVV